jgi:hypothetical protein
MHANMLGETSHTYAHLFKHTVHMHAQTNARSNCIRGPAAAQCAENVAYRPILLLHMHRPNLAKERTGRGKAGVWGGWQVFYLSSRVKKLLIQLADVCTKIYLHIGLKDDWSSRVLACSTCPRDQLREGNTVVEEEQGRKRARTQEESKWL